MAHNMICDHRVSLRRQQVLQEYLNAAGSTLQRAINDYLEGRVRRRTTPDFLDPALNGGNILTGLPSTSPPALRGSAQLVRVLNLNGLKPVFFWAYQQRLPTLMSRVSKAALDRDFPSCIDSFLDGELQASSKTDQTGLVDMVLGIMEAYRRAGYPYQPTWAALWEEFKEYVPGGPDRWRQALGLPSLGQPRWLVVLRYTVAEAGNLVWPTQLDAGWQAYHFPSPPQADPPIRGHPVDLGWTLPPGRLIREFVHHQIPHRIEHFTDPGGLIDRTTGTDEPLTDARSAHHQRLTERYGTNVQRWMESPV